MTARFALDRTAAAAALLVALLTMTGLLGGCVTVRPQERAALADPSMQFDGDPHLDSQMRHALDNREGSYGGGGVSGGGCGCN